ncbi:MAG: 3-hydroxyacyl-CoA dehydrogenase family protein [Nitrososphaerota archaeon]
MRSREVLIVGAGTMGSGIASVFASKKFDVTLLDVSEAQLKKSKVLIERISEILLRFGSIEDTNEVAERITFEHKELKKLTAKDFLFALEATFENPSTKAEVLKEMDSIISKDCVISSTTSGINIHELVDYLNPERIIITHFFNPPFIVPLVEVVPGPKTNRETLDKTLDLLKNNLKYKVILLSKYIPGFVVNRLTAALAREAAYLVELGIVSPEDLDTAIIANYGLKFPFEGIFELFDYIGWDVAKMVGVYIFPTLCNSTEGMKIAEDMVSKGRLGVKTGRGLKDYTGKTIEEVLEKRWIKMLKVLNCVKNL